MNSFPSLLLCVALCTPVFAAPLSALDEELQKTWPNNRTINIAFHGHSVPSGYHRTPDVRPFESYPYLFLTQLKERYPFAVLNVITTAIGGENSGPGAARFAADVFPHKPDLIYLDYALNDRNLTLPAMETNWRAMINAAKAEGIPLVLATPTGASNADLANPSDPLTERAELIRALATSEEVLLADLSAAWLAELATGTPQTELLSQGNHPNLAGHTVAANAIFASFLEAIDAQTTVLAASFPNDGTTKTFTTPDSLLTFTTSDYFTTRADFVGNGGGTNANAWDSNETLSIALQPDTGLSGLGLRFARSNIIVTGFTADPETSISGAGTNSAVWDPNTNTLTLDIAWDNGAGRQVTFANPEASAGQTLSLSFTDTTPNWQVAFTSFSYTGTTP